VRPERREDESRDEQLRQDLPRLNGVPFEESSPVPYFRGDDRFERRRRAWTCASPSSFASWSATACRSASTDLSFATSAGIDPPSAIAAVSRAICAWNPRAAFSSFARSVAAVVVVCASRVIASRTIRAAVGGSSTTASSIPRTARSVSVTSAWSRVLQTAPRGLQRVALCYHSRDVDDPYDRSVDEIFYVRVS
jgi:hypothetical protein